MQITVTLKGEEDDADEARKQEEPVSETELVEYPENFEANRRQERTLRKQQKKKIKDKKAARTITKEKGKN